MASEHIIPITNGMGTKEIINGTYNVTAEFTWYDASSIQPTSVEVVENTAEYVFTIAATGTLTLHISDDGTDVGVPIEGATFQRCDADGNVYGDVITSDVDGNAVFEHMPFSADGTTPTIYYKQLSSDGEHEFNSELQNTTMAEGTVTLEVGNAAAAEKTFKITDANYENLPIVDGNITLAE